MLNFNLGSNDKLESLSIWNFFPAFNFSLMILLIFFGLSFNIVIFNYYRINYIYIFEIDPKERITALQAMQLGISLSAIWFLLYTLFFITINFNFFNSSFSIFPLLSLILIVGFILWPFRHMYYTFRKAIMATIVKNLIPIGKKAVRFKDFIFGDILTSMVRPFTTLTITICLMSCSLCKANNNRYFCNRNDDWALVLTLMPYIIRFFQCLNRWYYTKMAWPNAFNALKYIGGLTNAYVGWLYNNKVLGVVPYVLTGVITISYQLYWDYYMDWGLFRELDNKNKKIFLREKLLYPSYYYYSAMINNFILRFIWLTNFISLGLSDAIIEGEIKSIFYSICEIFRRVIWCLFRVENENVNNFEKYRTILDMPMLPEFKND